MRFLHLSDLHFDNNFKSYFKEFIINGLLDDLNKNFSDRKIDFIVITGDLINQGGKNFNGDIDHAFKEFDETFLSKITEKLELSNDSIYICAGNHDLDFNLDSEIAETGLSSVLSDTMSVKKYIFDSNSDEGIKRISPYNNYFDKWNKSYIKRGKFHSNYSYTFSDKKVLITSYNNVWRCYGTPNDNKNLWLGEQQIVDSLDLCADANLSIAIMHYPLSELNPLEADRIETLLSNSYDILLTGHTHSASTIKKNCSSSEIIVSNCPSNWTYNTFGNNHEFKNGYSVIDVDFTNQDVIFNHRIYSNKKLQYLTNLEIGVDGVSKLSFNKKDKKYQKDQIITQDYKNYTIIHKPNEMSFDVISGSVLRSKINKEFYWKRDFDNIIADSINNNQSIIILGNSLAGKSRALFEALKDVKDRTVIIPDTTNSKWIRNLPQTDYSKILICDDVQLLIRRFGIEGIEKVIRDVLADDGMVAMTCRSGIEYYYFFSQLSAPIRESIKNITIDKMDNITENAFLEYLRKYHPDKLNEVDYTAFDHNLGSYFLELTIMKERFIKLEEIINEYNQGINLDIPRLILQALKLFYITHNFSGNKSFDIRKIKDYCERRYYGKRFGYYNESSTQWKNSIGQLLLEKQKSKGLLINNIEWERALNILSSNEFELNFISKTLNHIQIEEAYLEQIITLPFSNSEIIEHIYELYQKQDIRRLGFITTQESFESMIQKSDSMDEALLYLKKQDLLGIGISIHTYLYILDLFGDFDTKLQVVSYAEKSTVPLKPILLKILRNDIDRISQLIKFLLKVKDYGQSRYIQGSINYCLFCKNFNDYKYLFNQYVEFNIELDSNFLKSFSKKITRENVENFIDLFSKFNIDLSSPITNTLIIKHKELGFMDIKELFSTSVIFQVDENSVKLLFTRYKLPINNFNQLCENKKINIRNNEKFLLEFSKCNIKIEEFLSLASELQIQIEDIEINCFNMLLKRARKKEMPVIIDFMRDNNISPDSISSEIIVNGVPDIIELKDYLDFLNNSNLSLTDKIIGKIMKASKSKELFELSELLIKRFPTQYDLIYEQLFLLRFQNDTSNFMKLIKLKSIEVEERVASVILSTSEWDIVSLVEFFEKEKINFKKNIIFKFILTSNSLHNTLRLVNKYERFDKSKHNSISLLVELSNKKNKECVQLIDSDLHLLCEIYKFDYLFNMIKKNKIVRSKIVNNIDKIKKTFHPRVADALQIIGDNYNSKTIIENLDFTTPTTLRVLANIFSNSKKTKEIAIENYKESISQSILFYDKIKSINSFSMYILRAKNRDECIWLIDVIEKNKDILIIQDDEYHSLRNSTIALYIRFIIMIYGMEQSISRLVEFNKELQLPINQLQKYLSRISTIEASKINFYCEIIDEMSNAS